ncbi:MAG: hypothetical protein AB7J13_11370, partial [Pyrinomonadaceae bacterium]
MGVDIDRLIAAVKGGTRVITVAGLTSTAAKAFVAGRLHTETGKKLAVVTETNSEMETWAADLKFWLDPATSA